MAEAEKSDAATRVPASRVAWGLSLLVVAVALWLRWSAATQWNFVDLADFVQGGRSILDGTDLYANYPGILPFNYPPFGGVLFVPLGAMGLGAAKWVITLTSLACYGLIMWIAGRALGMSSSVLGLVTVGGLALEPLLRNAVLGQVNLILMAMVLVDIFVLPPRWRGVLVGVAGGIKLTPAFFLVFYLLRRDWGAALRAAAAGVVTVIVGWVAAPASSQYYWLGDADKIGRFGEIALTAANQSVRAVLSRALSIADPPTSVFVPIAVAGLALAAWSAHRQLQMGHDLDAVLALAVGTLLASPISWTHHWVWVLPALLVLHRRGPAWTPWLVGAIFFIAPMWLLPTGRMQELTYSLPQVVLSATYTFCGIAFLLWMLQESGRSRGEY